MHASHQHVLLTLTATTAAQGYKMRDEDEAFNNPDHDGGIRTALRVWFEDSAAAKAKYGPIASWDTSEVTDMSWLFRHKGDFNEDISRWDVGQVESMDYLFFRATSFNGDLSHWEVGQVETMNYMFYGATSFTGDLSRWEVGQVESMASMFERATSFTRQLGGAWSTSTASKKGMFRNSPGTITGRTKNGNGTIQ